jgi:hypothetical protein
MMIQNSGVVIITIRGKICAYWRLAMDPTAPAVDAAKGKTASPYTIKELRTRRKGLGDLNFMKQIADLLNALETQPDKRQELPEGYRNAVIPKDAVW